MDGLLPLNAQKLELRKSDYQVAFFVLDAPWMARLAPITMDGLLPNSKRLLTQLTYLFAKLIFFRNNSFHDCGKRSRLGVLTLNI